MNTEDTYKLVDDLRRRHAELGALIMRVAETLGVDDDEVFAWRFGNVTSKQRALLKAVVDESGHAAYSGLMKRFDWSASALGQVRGRSPFVKAILNEEQHDDDWYYVLSDQSLERLRALL
ncbi:hypothetical protein GCM10028798_34050 [Humibacter antri]